MRIRSVVVALLASTPVALAAQQGSVLSSYQRARALLDQAITAHGGLAALQAAGTVRVTMEGVDHWRNQSRKAAPPYDTEPWTADLWLDQPKARMVWTNASRFVGGFSNVNRTVIDGARGFSANLRQQTHLLAPNRTLDSQRPILFRLPHLVLLAARDQASSLRSIGAVTLSDGTRVDAIVVAVPPGLLTLGFDPASHQLRAVLGVQGDPLAGDAPTEVVFTDYRRTGDIAMPGRRLQRVAGELLQDVRYVEATLGTAIPDSLLALPAGSVELPAIPPAVSPVRELAPGVWAINGAGYWSLAVAFAEYVLVVEAPGGGVPETIARVGELAPGKPIRYVVPTHHHDDHAGGARHYIAQGTTVLTTPGNREYFTRMAGAHATLRPDRQSEVRAAVKVELIEGKRRVISDGTRSVELIDIGPSPHANEMVVAWLPAEGILFQGDLLNLGPGGAIYRSTANATTVHFAEWLRRQRWDVRVLAGVHMPPGTVADLDTALARRVPAP